MDMEYLKYKIRKTDMNLEEFSKIIGISKSAMYLKVRGKRQWKYEDMKKIKSILNLSSEEFNKIFGF